jgi:hypothetical protein
LQSVHLRWRRTPDSILSVLMTDERLPPQLQNMMLLV